MTEEVFKVGRQLVSVCGELYPAVNIQVENVPGHITFEGVATPCFDHNCGHHDHYGVYFEVMTEDGEVIVVHQLHYKGYIEVYHISGFDSTQEKHKKTHMNEWFTVEQYLRGVVKKSLRLI